MSDYMADLSGVLGARTAENKDIKIARKGSNSELDMMDFVQLMIAQMTNQGIDNTMDTSEMLSQMVQMQMIQSLVNMTDATMMSYSASLVGKEVTVGKQGSDGTLQEIVGTVTGTGTMDGQPVVFVNDEYYYLNEIMAVGKLPPKKEEDADKVEGADTTEGAGQTGPADEAEETANPGGAVQPGGGAQNAENGGESGTPENSGE